MKKILILLMILICVVGLLSGCGGALQTPQPDDTAAADEQTQEDVKASDTAAEPETQEPEQAAANTALIEPEQLISQADAEALLGEAVVGEKKEQPAVGQKIMFYKAADESSNQYLQISLTQQAFMDPGSASTPQQLYTDICAAFEAETISGIGDEAQKIPSGYQIMSHGYYLAITAGFTSDDEGIMSEAGKLAVKNLEALLAG